jgi:hypothetical protein
MKSIIILITFFMSALIASGEQSEIYFWTDENGVKHYSQTPPSDHSLRVKTALEIQSNTSVDQNYEIINEENVEAILKQLDQEDAVSAPKTAEIKKPPTRQERIQAAAENLEEKIKWLEQLPPQAYTNSRSKQAIIGRYQYRLQQLRSNPDAYFKEYGY